MLGGEHESTLTSTDVYYAGGDTFALSNRHDASCKAASLPNLQQRVKSTVKDVHNKNSIEYLHGKKIVPTATTEALEHEETCARDNKSYHVETAMRRKECDCHSQFFTLVTIYRFWKCTSEIPLDDLGLADASVPIIGNGKRDFWFPESRVHLDQQLAAEMDPSMQPYGLNHGDGRVCIFNDSSDIISLVEGRTQFERDEHIDYASGISLQYTSANFSKFGTYADLKQHVREEYDKEHEQLLNGSRSNIDPILFDLYTSIKLIEQFGQTLENLVHLEVVDETLFESIDIREWLNNGKSSNLLEFSGSLEWCECQNLLKCPNGTATNGEGATSIDECLSTKREVLHRVTLLPPPPTFSNLAIPSTLEGTVDESPTLHLQPYDVAILTIDQSMLPNNFTYGEHYRISVYDGCKPCPLRYQCSAESSSCLDPPAAKQHEHLNQCLKDNRKLVCLLADGTYKDVEKCEQMLNETGANSENPQFMLLSEPDIEKCLLRPYFCSKTEWDSLSFRRLCQDSLPNGKLSPVYDCADVLRWEVYSRWRNDICCSSVPELRDIDSCDEGSLVCTSNPLIEDIIRDKLIGVFESENGYTPPIEQPLGHLLMNASMQEARDHHSPIELFSTWNSPFVANNLEDGTEFESKPGQPWIQSDGCCTCTSESMPHFFESPESKHQPIQITISALEEVDLSVVVELLHGRYYSEFNDYFGGMDKAHLRIHSPRRFAEGGPIGGTWLTIIEESTFDKLNLDLPLNLPFSKSSVYGESGDKESRFLLDRPSNHSIGSPNFVSLGDETDARSDGIAIDPFRMVNHINSWSHDFIALPYLPFFSNCDGYDSHISLSRLLEEHPDCQQVDLDKTVPTKEYAFWSKSPISDACLGVLLHCTYEEKVSEARDQLRWFEASPKSKLFYIVSNCHAICLSCLVSVGGCLFTPKFTSSTFYFRQEMQYLKKTFPHQVQIRNGGGRDHWIP